MEDVKRSDPFDYLLERALRAEQEPLIEAVMRGDVADFADYKFHCGQIRGIQFAIERLRELRHKTGREEE